MESGLLRAQDPERVSRSYHGVVAVREGRLCRVRSVGDAQWAGGVREPDLRKGCRSLGQPEEQERGVGWSCGNVPPCDPGRWARVTVLHAAAHNGRQPCTRQSN